MSMAIRRGAALSLALAMSAISIWGQRDVFAFLFLSSNAWVSSSAVVAVAALVVSILVYLKTSELSRKIADRTVTIEAQKLLLEINKLFVSDPRLLIVYRADDQVHKLIEKIGTETRAELSSKAPELLKAIEPVENFAGKLAALGFMLLNVFEIVFAQMPGGPEYNTWVNYFKDTLDRCPIVCKSLELPEAKVIYHPKLMAAYQAWLGGKQKQTAKAD